MSYTLNNPTAMLSAVAWNYATRFFQIRIYMAGENDKLLSYSFSRDLDGWTLVDQSEDGSTPCATARSNVSLSAVAAVILENECNPRVYFYPRRIIAEWDVCKETTSFVVYEEGKKTRKHTDGKSEKGERGVPTFTEEDLRNKRWREVQYGDTVKLQGDALVKRAKKACPNGFYWKKVAAGWRCTGGQHFLYDVEFEALATTPAGNRS
ncbi:hypothetical protein F5Y13DRAFT_204333 [Hypoxylon sp. FL1857]|nr:hypothetical protein F5Y13DRAFT_204333 [Hypoxylon sp. FL1857]